MKELKCPKCGSVFSVDEADYALILSQVKNAEFSRELKERVAEAEKARNAAFENERLKLSREFDKKLSDKDIAAAALQTTIAELNNRIANADNAAALQLERQKAADALALSELDKKISNLNLELQAQRNEAERREAAQKLHYEEQLKQKDETIRYYADMKQRLSTKMLGESLEQHCSNTFNSVRAMAFPSALFEKDNDASGGSKGDFIFRDFDGDDEYISIMFEMKNEMDTTATKHRNEDFFDKLDRDRRAKNCEYAVLVSLLERDSDLYNEGIVDVSYRYDKMYVIRPQFFLPVISMLSKASRKSIVLKRQLEIAQNQTIDVTDFEIKLDRFKSDFARHMSVAHNKYAAAIEKIDRSIKALQDIRKLFEDSEKHLLKAEGTLRDDLTIKKLTYGNKTMKEKFAEAGRKS